MFKLNGGLGNLEIPDSVVSPKNQYSSSTIVGEALISKLDECSSTTNLPISVVPNAILLFTSVIVPIVRLTSAAPRSATFALREIPKRPIFDSSVQSPVVPSVFATIFRYTLTSVKLRCTNTTSALLVVILVTASPPWPSRGICTSSIMSPTCGSNANPWKSNSVNLKSIYPSHKSTIVCDLFRISYVSPALARSITLLSRLYKRNSCTSLIVNVSVNVFAPRITSLLLGRSRSTPSAPSCNAVSPL